MNTKDTPLRDVDIDGYRLTIWHTGYLDRYGKTILRYEFRTPAGFAQRPSEMLFRGDDFACAPQHAEDSDHCLRHVLGFLTLGPDDIEREYFTNYTAAQMAFAASDQARLLSLWADDSAADDYAFIDWQDPSSFSRTEKEAIL